MNSTDNTADNDLNFIDLTKVFHGSDAFRSVCAPGDIDDCAPERWSCAPDGY